MELHSAAGAVQRPKSRQANAIFLADLREAVATGSFLLEYQAQFDLEARRVTAFEALVRWQHPVRGLVPPAAFIATAERVGLIDAIGRWVLHRACQDAATWPHQIGVAVNVSAKQLQPDLVQTVLQALRESGLDPRRLELEITETASVAVEGTALNVLHALQAIGVRIAIDDFDVRHASLGYLIEFPFDKLKIDASLVAHVGAGHRRAEAARMVVRSVCRLCADLHVECSVEGVETQAQLDLLIEAGCGEVQGFLLAPPVPVERVLAVARQCAVNGPRASAPQPAAISVMPFAADCLACGSYQSRARRHAAVSACPG